MQSWVSYMSFHPMWCCVWLVSSWEMVSHLSRCELNRAEDRCCDLSNVGTVETVGLHQVMWFVMLEYAKDQILGVDTPGQHVPPRVQYGTTCLWIRYVIGCVSCSVEWGWLPSLWLVSMIIFVNCLNHMVQEGPLCAGSLSTARGDCLSGNHCKAWRSPIVDLCNDT
jgi:hypothetical protein